MKNKEHTILNEKYRAKDLTTFICSEDLKAKFQSFIDDQDIPMIGLFGKAGSGKTSLAKIFCNLIVCDYLLINAADERSIDIIREKVGGFAS